MMIKIFLSFLFLFLSPFYLIKAFPSVQKEIEDLIETFQKDHEITGISAAVIGRENLQKFHQLVFRGTLSRKSPIPINGYSEFRLGPLTQLFTAATLAYFVKEGQVSLSDPVSKFLPKSIELPSYQGEQITLGDLATHTSGLPDLPYNLSSRASFSVSQMFRFLNHYELKEKPGITYRYSNLGYALLANILMRISKQSFPLLLHHIIVDPLHLGDTIFSLSAEQKKRLATGYEKGKGVAPLTSEKIYSVFIGSGGLYSTPQDMLSWLSFNMGKETTSLNAILPLMQHTYHQFPKFRVGLGWKIEAFSNQKDLFMAQGLLFGFGAYMGIVPDLNIGVILMTTQGDLSLESLGEEILKLLEKALHS
jgi:D-alanyl-D-alanine-carboxypeptidase/D-alanyl-D-alanine-endopeptidase